jgi:hypothetical protein
MQNHLQQEAMRLAALGYKVFPCVPREKRPLTRHGVHDATTNEQQIEIWWDQWPNANIGLSTDGLIVIDVDAKEDGKPNDWLTNLGPLETLTTPAKATSPRGGMHFFFRDDSQPGRRNTAGEIAKNVDTRATGGYVLVAPSETASGRYTWLHGGVLNDSRDELPELPEWLGNALAVKKVQPLYESVGDSGEIISGNRNQTLTRFAGLMRRGGMTGDQIYPALLKINADRCKPALETDEVRKIAESVGRYEPDQAVEASITSLYETPEEVDSDSIPDPGHLSKELLSPPGLMRDIVAWNLETAYKQQHELALAGALSLMSVITGRKVQDETGTRTNLYVVGVAASGSGKEHARKINKRILSSITQHEMLGAESFASYQGLINSVEQSPAILFQIDEMGKLLEALAKADSGPQAQIITTLMKLYSSADSVFVPEARADLKTIKRINQPHAVIYGTSVPDNLFGSFSRENINDGFLGRLLIVESSDDDPEPREIEPIFACPKDIVFQVDQWAKWRPGENLAELNPQPATITYETAAKQRYKEMESLCREEANKRPDYRGLWSRAVEKARKLGLLYQCSVSSIVICKLSREAADWGCLVTEHLTRRMMFLADRWIVSGQRERHVKALLRRICEAGEMTQSQVTRTMQHIDARTRAEILRDLIESGQVEKKQIVTTGRPRTVFIARG